MQKTTPRRAPTSVSEPPLQAANRAKAYNILVSAHDAAWETDQLMRMPADRFREHTPDFAFAAGIDLARPRTLRRLERVPTLLLYESCVGGAGGDVVRIGAIRDVRHTEGELSFAFSEHGRASRTVVEKLGDRLDISPWQFNRTHWAIKPGGLPAAFLAQVQLSYDVVLSYAGEDRGYVERVAMHLRRQGVRVFYDRFEEAALWGKDLAEHLDSIYRRAGTYCVLFISAAYRDKMWTVHERRAALARALEERSEYLLPSRFDQSELPGLRPTVAYVDLTRKRPHALAKLLLAKLGKG
jgi:hypothetical protein